MNNNDRKEPKDSKESLAKRFYNFVTDNKKAEEPESGKEAFDELLRRAAKPKK